MSQSLEIRRNAWPPFHPGNCVSHSRERTTGSCNGSYQGSSTGVKPGAELCIPPRSGPCQGGHIFMVLHVKD